jgi:hypothetical protein
MYIRTAIWCIILILASCTPQKRLNRLVKKHPELIKVDTLSVHDTIHIETIKADTVFKDTTFLRLLRDTITVVNDRLRINTYHYRDSIFIEGECIGDTIIREIRVPYKYIQPVTKVKTPAYIIILLVGLVILLILLGIKSLRE